ncbi:hypothetical protein L1S35_05255 [Flavobacterium sp. AS60]|uniref:hypothetical protein n=1 Tax=Flavobacterium anseongense TaxID=2910677 RepID=UPI001F36B40C|nr:hypothetical protein [Flavobacterium sp. AS60]MCF6129072.1 hypothetical protein [Flavobacterium sp. AS60]
MTNHYICPNCEKEEYFFDGEKLKCPNCDQMAFEKALYLSEGNYQFQSLAKLNVPFFRLDCGEIFTCIAEKDNRTENTSIIPIAYAEDSNKLFFAFEAEKLTKEMPKMLNEIMTKTFSELFTLKINFDFHDDIGYMVVIGASQEDNSIIEYNGYVFKNFSKINSR